ncbi:F-box protein At4g00755-like isoform X2 [Salvia splendens]|nr:F-box protein At4g00755-like isoform X2 [Salvia splendens]XP_042066317.1 F-box protein At4g00755-like isoform X2 [Salvia splendens]XP_042066326.1 F-box protein At4g00755-like isoform X2 [Salvia splendens]
MICSWLEYMDCKKIETSNSFIDWLETDVFLYVMSFLDDPADIATVSAVSCHWRRFVIANGLAKQLCLKNFPQLSGIVEVVNGNEGTTNSVAVNASSAVEWAVLKRDHWAYASLLQAILKSKVSPKDCIAKAVSASSTDNYPDESVVNTLNPRDRFIRRASYWSSKGQSNPDVPETLVYKLSAGIWVITEVDIQPFEAFFQMGKPIYSAKFVRFRMGHLKSPREIGDDLQCLPLQKPDDDKFVWTYTSPQFPMTQENCLQPFKLPDPVLCVGGYMQIELLGRVQRQEIDGLFYICVCYVRVLGRPLFPAFNMEILEPDGELLLKFYPKNLNCVLQNSSRDEIPELRHLEEKMLLDRIGLLEDLLRGIQEGPNHALALEEDDDEDGMDADLVP